MEVEILHSKLIVQKRGARMLFDVFTQKTQGFIIMCAYVWVSVCAFFPSLVIFVEYKSYRKAKYRCYMPEMSVKCLIREKERQEEVNYRQAWA